MKGGDVWVFVLALMLSGVVCGGTRERSGRELEKGVSAGCAARASRTGRLRKRILKRRMKGAKRMYELPKNSARVSIERCAYVTRRAVLPIWIGHWLCIHHQLFATIMFP